MEATKEVTISVHWWNLIYSVASLLLLHSLSHGSSDPSLKLFGEATNQWRGNSFCSITKPHLHHYRCYTPFPMLLTDFHCSRCHSSDTILGFLQIFVMQHEAAHQLHCHPSILLLVWNFISFIILVIIPQTQPFFFFKFLRYENKHIVSNTDIIWLQFLYILMKFN